jgi:hypothetical protein
MENDLKGKVAGDLRAGDWVEVKSPEEIAQTLDANGTLEGLPFMPEMIEYCGKRFRVSRKARKACIECVAGTATIIDMREFLGDAVWVIEDLRCTGAGHDGCQRGCLLFWRAAWLRRLESPGPSDQPVKEEGCETLLRKLKSRTAPDRYFCQSTELVNVSKPLSLSGRLRICLRDILAGDVGLFEMIKAIVFPVFWKMVHAYVTPVYVRGPLTHTPLIQIGLKPGELVEVKRPEEIRQTLNSKGRNRGLRYDHGLNQFCGTRHVVRDRLDRIIVESTGRMVKIEGTVTLADTTCLCYMNAFGGCVRKDLVYWREAWLNRVEAAPGPSTSNDLMASASCLEVGRTFGRGVHSTLSIKEEYSGGTVVS